MYTSSNWSDLRANVAGRTGELGGTDKVDAASPSTLDRSRCWSDEMLAIPSKRPRRLGPLSSSSRGWCE